MDATVQMWGNSLALRIPKKMAQSQNIGPGTSVFISPEDDGFKVRPIVSEDQEPTLEDLLAGITEKNKPGEIFARELPSEAW